MIKALRKPGIDKMYINYIKALYENIQPTSYLNGKTETILPKLRNETRVPTLPTLI
jgi:hypothetical protein